MTHAETVKAEDTRIRGRMLLFLNQPEEFVAELLSEQGNEFLDVLFTETATRKKVAYSTGFWEWFKNQWALADQKLSNRLKVDKLSRALHYSLNESSTHFIHGNEEFIQFYAEYHRCNVRHIGLPSELCERWVRQASQPTE